MRTTHPALALLPAATLVAALVAALGSLSGCDLVPSPEHQSEAARKAAEHHQLRDAIEHKSEMDRARNAGAPVIEADKQHDQAIDDAGG